MSYGNQTSRPVAVVPTPTNPNIRQVSLVAANTEYSETLTPNIKQFFIRARGNSKLQFCFTTGQSNTNFISIPRGVTWPIVGVNFTGTIYLRGDQAGETVEILEWI